MRLVIAQPKTRGSADENFAYIANLLDAQLGEVSGCDVVLLPELVGFGLDTQAYLAGVSRLAERYKAHVIGGSHFRLEGNVQINQGVVVAPDGRIVTAYEKANPYFDERKHGAARGNGGAYFEINGAKCFVTICADFFHAETFMRLPERADVIFVSASSVSRKPTPDLARARWKHAMIARAFEQSAYVAVSDWAYPVGGQNDLPASGVSGVAYPDAETPEGLINTVGQSELAVYDFDLNLGRQLYDDQQARGFAIAGIRGQE